MKRLQFDLQVAVKYVGTLALIGATTKVLDQIIFKGSIVAKEEE